MVSRTHSEPEAGYHHIQHLTKNIIRNALAGPLPDPSARTAVSLHPLAQSRFFCFAVLMLSASVIQALHSWLSEGQIIALVTLAERLPLTSSVQSQTHPPHPPEETLGPRPLENKSVSLGSLVFLPLKNWGGRGWRGKAASWRNVSSNLPLLSLLSALLSLSRSFSP